MMSRWSRDRPNAGISVAAHEARGRVVEGEAELAQPARAFGPGRRVGGEQRQMLLVGKARHGVVGLGFEINVGETALRRRGG